MLRAYLSTITANRQKVACGATENRIVCTPLCHIKTLWNTLRTFQHCSEKFYSQDIRSHMWTAVCRSFFYPLFCFSKKETKINSSPWRRWMSSEFYFSFGNVVNFCPAMFVPCFAASQLIHKRWFHLIEKTLTPQKLYRLSTTSLLESYLVMV